MYKTHRILQILIEQRCAMCNASLLLHQGFEKKLTRVEWCPVLYQNGAYPSSRRNQRAHVGNLYGV